MSRLQLQDSRRLRFPAAAVLDAALTFDREHNGWLWRGSQPVLTIDPAGQGAVAIEACPQGADARQRVERSPAWTAAALMHYCFKRRIPIPRQASKTIEVVPEGLVLCIEVPLSLPALELSSGQAGAAAAASGPAGAAPGVAAAPAGPAPAPVAVTPA